MEIGATSSSSYLPLPAVDARPARPVVAREVSGARDVAVGGDRKDGGGRQSGVPSDADSLKSAETRQTPASRQAAQVDEARRAPRQEAEKQEVEIAAGGGIKFDVEDGRRVLKVFDSKDVLIYQLPPKGALTLIKAQESAEQSQVQTSA